MRNKRKRLWILVFVFFILVFAGPSISKGIKGTANIKKNTYVLTKEIESPHSSQVIYEKLDDGIIKYWEGILSYYDMNGNIKWNFKIGANNPLIKAGGNNIYIVDNNKRELICVDNNGKIPYRLYLKGPVFHIKPSEENFVLLQYITEKNKPQQISVINNEGKDIATLSIGQGEVTAIELSQKHNRIAVGTLGVNQSNIESNLLIYDLQGNLITLENQQSQVILELLYDTNGNLTVFQEDDITSIDKGYKKQWDVHLEQIKKLHVNNKEGYSVIYSSSNKRGVIYTRSNEKIKVLQLNGRFTGEKKIDEEIIGIDSWENNIITYSTRTIYLLNKKGNLLLEHPYSSDIIKIYIFPNNQITVITKEKIAFYKLEGR